MQNKCINCGADTSFCGEYCYICGHKLNEKIKYASDYFSWYVVAVCGADVIAALLLVFFG